MMLSIDNLTVQFNTDDGIVHAVNGVTLSIDAGETVGIVGESGCGKTVTAMSILRLIPTPPGKIISGSIVFAGEDILSLPEKRLQSIRGSRIGMIFQEPMTALSPLHLIGNQLTEVFDLHCPQMSRGEKLVHSEEMLHKVGIPDVSRCMSAYPHELSGGMRQRVMIAMAMLLEPELIIADEPTTALDVTIQAQILELLQQMTQGATDGKRHALLLITHDMGVIWQMCTRVVVMYASRVVESAPVKELFAHPRHPYTKALLSSIPALCKNHEQLTSIEGTVPSLLQPLPGCPFAPRCPYAKDICHTHLPEVREISDGHQCRCFI